VKDYARVVSVEGCKDYRVLIFAEALKANPHLSHAEALRASMLRMIADPSKSEWAQPQFWAPFVVVGEPQKR
jgi:CHAT domain-containing protein